MYQRRYEISEHQDKKYIWGELVAQVLSAEEHGNGVQALEEKSEYCKSEWDAEVHDCFEAVYSSHR